MSILIYKVECCRENYSGGLQKEAYFLKTPCTTLRDQIEWIETLDYSWNVLSDINVEEIIDKVQRELTCLQYLQNDAIGDGNAAAKIYEAIEKE